MDPNAQSIHIKIVTPVEVLYEGDAQTLSSTNSVGRFDILPEHANFITMIENQPIDIKTTQGVKQFSFPLAIIMAAKNQVKVYTDIQDLPKLT